MKQFVIISLTPSSIVLDRKPSADKPSAAVSADCFGTFDK